MESVFLGPIAPILVCRLQYWQFCLLLLLLLLVHLHMAEFVTQ